MTLCERAGAAAVALRSHILSLGTLISRIQNTVVSLRRLQVLLATCVGEDTGGVVHVLINFNVKLKIQAVRITSAPSLPPHPLTVALTRPKLDLPTALTGSCY